MYPGTRRLRVGCAALIIVVCLLWIRYHPTPRTSLVDFVAPFLIKKKDIELRLKGDSVATKTKIELIQENKRLKEELDNLRLHLRESRILKQENLELRGLLNLQKPKNVNYLAARIISKDPASGGRRVRIDRGEVHGVAIGQAVLANGFLYGRILETSDQTALIVTIIDPNCKLSVNINNTNIHGILSGRRTDRWKVSPICIVKYLPRDFEYKPGMKVETSALGAMIPAKLPVGELVPNTEQKMTETVDNLYRIASVKPLDLFHEINFVTIITTNQD